jgi:hypothetical protein
MYVRSVGRQSTCGRGFFVKVCIFWSLEYWVVVCIWSTVDNPCLGA